MLGTGGSINNISLVRTNNVEHPVKKPSPTHQILKLIMAYYQILKESPYREYLSPQLEKHLQAASLEDASVKYVVPEIEIMDMPLKKKESFVSKPTDVRLPARLSSPLIPYPKELHELCKGTFAGDKDIIHGHHYSQLTTLNKVFGDCVKAEVIPSGELRFDMDSLKRCGRQSYSHREDLINLATLSFAKRATKHDLSISANDDIPFEVAVSNVSKYTSFIIMIQRLRVHIAKESNFPLFNVKGVQTSGDEATYTMFSNGVYIYQSNRKSNRFCIMACGGHFRMYHEVLNYWFCGPTSYLDYIFTIADILNNLDVLKNCEEYAWAIEMFKLMIEFAEHEGHHKEQVDFMKTLEGFLLNMSDYDEEFAMNWKPILEAIEELWKLDQIISGVTYDMGLPLSLLRRMSFVYPEKSFLCKFIIEGCKLSRTHLQEISALHKLIFYAEVNAEAGVLKFLKRVHTKRQVDHHAVKNLTRLAKLQFFTAYRKRHKMIPQIIGPPAKVKMLETYGSRSDTQRIESLPLSWWDEIKIFNCMDNTLTDDPLEFAKDKGALKSKISFGPGDSRKELLQVIETENYQLKDFFAGRTIRPKARCVRRTHQKETAEEMSDPARLIEKEREQKYEARLFANGELSNKHALSLVAARMKKALSYFDEQLMTPTDKKRKALIHEAARELSQPDNYSLLLDIEGHNQSMQYENTHELAEFLGNLFGYDGWGDLAHYFSQLTVYHYDEYLDNVLESHGQYGGIEGWLNPFWTLHTTLMMKLLRIMTDVDVRTIMVYSDDVNAIVKIKQSSEPMIQSVFSKIMKHCTKFGMTIKYSQTNLSKHRITMLRQHYADGVRADSTLKRLISVSAGNNAVLISDELEVSGICSSASSAMELSNHHEACAYLKNYKLGLLLCRMPHMILSHLHDDSMVSSQELPEKLSNLLYYSKQEQSLLDLTQNSSLYAAAKNDIAAYLNRSTNHMNDNLLRTALASIYGVGIAESRLVDSPDRVLYLQVYDEFLQDLLFFWTYLPTSVGGLGASLHLNLMLSGHSIGMSKSLHYLHLWTHKFSCNSTYFLKYLSTALSVTMEDGKNTLEDRVVTNTWPSDQRICPATTSVQQSIKSMVRRFTVNRKIKEMFDLSDDREGLAQELVEIFRNNFHARIVQFYHENTSIHFIDLLISKIETSSGLLTKVKNITRLRNSLCHRAIENIRAGSMTNRTYFFNLEAKSDIIECLLTRKVTMFPKISFIEVEEVLYDDKITEVDLAAALITVRRCAPTHYRNGIRVYDDPKVGNEVLYKGELLDNDRLLGNKEELLAAKLVAVTKWFLMKHNLMALPKNELEGLDILKACNLSLSTLTRQTFQELFHFAPAETGGEILHRIPNIRFSTATYIRSEMNRSLHYTTEMSQRLITMMGLVDSNINFDYLRMRLLIIAIIKDKYDSLRRLVTRYGFTRLTGIKDVQFVLPKHSSWEVKKVFQCYSDIRGHVLSKPRFRYLSHSYLHEENVNDWALMPTLAEELSAEQVGKNYVNDIILRYSRDLDKDYMFIKSDSVDAHLWKPLIMKLNKIDPKWRIHLELTEEEEIAQRLVAVMEQRSRITTVDKANKVMLSLQTQCLDAITENQPSDTEFQLLVQRFSAISQNRRHSSRLSIRLSQYQALLSSYEEHRFNLAQSLIHEYILTFHFKTQRINQELTVDTESSVSEFLQTGLARLSLMIVNPELQVRLMILGFEFVEKIIETRMTDIIESLRAVCSDATCADIVVPETLPSMPAWTPLTGEEAFPPALDEIEYILDELPLSALATIEQAAPLIKYAHLCSVSGASPECFTSHTGSDSLGAQFALFRTLLSQGIVDETMSICDLTAGRGDGIYAAKYLGLSVHSFSREDTFTRLNYHPEINFRPDYDIFNGATLKFLTEFDFIHIDVSFTGASDRNSLDLLLFLEENNLSYSLRINSLSIHEYNSITTAHLSTYDHYISYAVSSQMKPSQIYLIGVPTSKTAQWDGPDMKDSRIFKSMALSYSRLLSPACRLSKLESFKPNSISLYIPTGNKGNQFIQKICDDSIEAEQQYYLKRYASEIGEGARLEFAYDCLQDRGKSLVETQARFFKVNTQTVYTTISLPQIGNVSEKSRPFHEKHINAMIERRAAIWSIDILQCDESLLKYFKIHHPLQEIRTWCNIVLGLHTFCRQFVTSGHGSIMDRLSELATQPRHRLSSHQQELTLAIKLLVLAARDDNYAYGVTYCHNLMTSRKKAPARVTRTIRIYRLISYLFDEIHNMMAHGLICIRSIEAISNELEVRERVKYKYLRQSESTPAPDQSDLNLTHIIDNSIDKLFSGLEWYTSNLIDESLQSDQPTTIQEALGASELKFDIGLSEHIDRMVASLNLTASGPRGIIDLGDDDIIEYDEW